MISNQSKMMYKINRAKTNFSESFNKNPRVSFIYSCVNLSVHLFSVKKLRKSINQDLNK